MIERLNMIEHQIGQNHDQAAHDWNDWNSLELFHKMKNIVDRYREIKKSGASLFNHSNRCTNINPLRIDFVRLDYRYLYTHQPINNSFQPTNS